MRGPLGGGQLIAPCSNSIIKPFSYGLVEHWTGDSADISGSIMYDRSPTQNNMTLVNSPSVVTGIIGDALSFNGTTQYAYASGTSGVNIQTNVPFSIVTWIKTPTGQTGQQIILSTYNNYPTNSGWVFEYGSPSNGILRFEFLNNNVSLTKRSHGSSLLVNSGNYTMASVTYDGSGNASGLTFYVNNVADITVVENNDSVGTMDNVSLWACRWTFGYSAGYRDEARMYNRTLSSQEISAIYAYGY